MKSIGLKLWIVMISLVVFILLLLWFFQIVFLEKYYMNARISEIKSEITEISKSIVNENNSYFFEQMEKLSFDNNIFVEIIDSENKILFRSEAASNNTPPMMRNSSRSDAIYSALQGKESTTILTHPRFSTKFLLMSLPISLNNNSTAALIINMPVAPVEDTASILKKQLIYISVTLLITAIFISFFISRSLTKPILQIKKVAEEISTGNFNNKLDIKRNDEIGDLSNTINNMSKELSKIDILRKELIANVSHELRTPLSLIRGYAETVRDVTWKNDEKRNNALNIVIEESERLSNIVNDILNLSLLQSDNFKLESDSFSLNELLENVINKYTLLKEKMQISLKLEIQDNIVVVADQKRIEQVLYNLINNAFNHTPENGSITVKAFIDNNLLKILISDTGTGIAKENLNHIWERFYKSSKENIRSLPATGLGLAIVKTILQSHNSLYGVESVEGSGTTFWFSLQLKNNS